MHSNIVGIGKVSKRSFSACDYQVWRRRKAGARGGCVRYVVQVGTVKFRKT
jgi:hypothetical protein